MFLHLMQPDKKFLTEIRSMFEEAAPGEHRYVAVGSSPEGDWLPENVIHIRDSAGLADIVSGEQRWQGVVIHGLPFSVAGSLLRLIPNDVRVAWYVWGFEAYGSWPPLSRSLYLPETRHVLERVARPRWKRWASPLKRAVLARKQMLEARRVVSRYDYCVTQYREEYELFVASGLLTKTRYHQGSVGAFEDFVEDDVPLSLGDDIQLGNSADPANNHLDAFTFLRNPQLEGRKVVVPLSYGDPRYAAAVSAIGREELGNRFVPLTEFLALSEYLRVIASCGHVVMNHLRQQALANIYAALWRGASVYMNDTPAFRGLRRLGFSVHLIEEEFRTNGAVKLPVLSQRQIAGNRSLLQEYLGRPTVVAQTAALLDKLNSGSRV